MGATEKRIRRKMMKQAMKARVMSAILMAGMVLGAVTLVAAEKNDTINLIKALNSENLGQRINAAYLLGEYEDTSAVGPLIAMLQNDIKYSARTSAAIALLRIGDVSAIIALKNSSMNDSNDIVRSVANEAYIMLQVSMVKFASN